MGEPPLLHPLLLQATPGHLDVGVSVPCPNGDHEHRILSALHTTVAENITIIAT